MIRKLHSSSTPSIIISRFYHEIRSHPTSEWNELSIQIIVARQERTWACFASIDIKLPELIEWSSGMRREQFSRRDHIVASGIVMRMRLSVKITRSCLSCNIPRRNPFLAHCADPDWFPISHFKVTLKPSITSMWAEGLTRKNCWPFTDTDMKERITMRRRTMNLGIMKEGPMLKMRFFPLQSAATVIYLSKSGLETTCDAHMRSRGELLRAPESAVGDQDLGEENWSRRIR